MNRVLAALGGVAVLGVALVMSFGTAVIALLALGAAALIQHGRARRLGAFPSLWIAVISMTLVVTAWFWTHLERNGGVGREAAAMAAAQTQPPPPQPAWLRELPGGNFPPLPTMQMPAKVNAVFVVVGLVIMSETLGGILGALTWAGVWLLRYSVRGTFSEESAPPAA
jgi:hypothetical protein